MNPSYNISHGISQLFYNTLFFYVDISVAGHPFPSLFLPFPILALFFLAFLKNCWCCIFFTDTNIEKLQMCYKIIGWSHVNMIIRIFLSYSYFFYIILYLKCYINFIIFFYLYNFNIFVLYSCYFYIILYLIIFLYYIRII